MSDIIENFIIDLRSNCFDYIDDNYDSYNNFDYLYDDLWNEVSGNISGHCSCGSKALAHELVWDSDFVSYCEDGAFDIGYYMRKGEDTICVLAAMFYISFFYNELEDYFDIHKEEDEEY